jgi:hypothetical protein
MLDPPVLLAFSARSTTQRRKLGAGPWTQSRRRSQTRDIHILHANRRQEPAKNYLLVPILNILVLHTGRFLRSLAGRVHWCQHWCQPASVQCADSLTDVDSNEHRVNRHLLLHTRGFPPTARSGGCGLNRWPGQLYGGRAERPCSVPVSTDLKGFGLLHPHLTRCQLIR